MPRSGFRSFWSQEEIPRWIGFSLVLVYTCGLTAAAWTAVKEARQGPLVAELLSKRRAVLVLGALLQEMPTDGTYAERRWLREFSRDFDCPQLRIVDAQGIVLASRQPEEVGSPTTIDPQIAENFPDGMETTPVTQTLTGQWQCLFRLPLQRDADRPKRFLEGAVVTARSGPPNPLTQAATLWVILAAVA
ncbi:MAG: hypothetical protein IH873_11450, partial [Chloroflexi bacterium]|nr:hypothetical protein [Chloroflexota bacterium]